MCLIELATSGILIGRSGEGIILTSGRSSMEAEQFRGAVDGPVLIVMPSVPMTQRDGQWFLDIKAVDGLRAFAKMWPGRVRCLFREGPAQAIAYGQSYSAAELPFEVVLIGNDPVAHAADLNDAAIILASGDNFRDLPLPAMINRPIVYVIEYTLMTRLRIVLIDRGVSLRAVRSALWTMLTERKRRRAFRRAAGLQANGKPAFDAYHSLVGNNLLYFDSRMTAAQIATPDDIIAKQAALAERRPLRLAYSGRLEPMKGADHLTAVAAHLKEAGTPFTLDVFGDGSLRQSIAQAIARLGLVDVVRMHGAVSFDQELVPALIQSIDLFICCHRQADPSCTYLETLSCGVPIVGYDNAAFRGVMALGAAGVRVTMGDTGAAAAAIAALDADRPRLAAMAATAVQVGRENSFERTFAKRIDQLRAIAGV